MNSPFIPVSFSSGANSLKYGSCFHFIGIYMPPEVKQHYCSPTRPVFLCLKEMELLAITKPGSLKCQLENNPNCWLCTTAVCCISLRQNMIRLQRKKTKKHEQTWKEKVMRITFYIYIFFIPALNPGSVTRIHTALGELTLLIMYHGSDWSSISMSMP